MHEDERGVIKDIFVGEDMAATLITFTEGAVRGNHLHKMTLQRDIVLEGELLFATDKGERNVKVGEIVFIYSNTPHAYKALKPSTILSISKGVRIGKNYEKDTYRLETSLLK